MKRKNLLIINLMLLILLAMLLNGCSTNKNPAIVILESKQNTSSDKITGHKLYMKDFLYEIWKVEREGNGLEDYYNKRLGISYWDYKYQGSSMRQLAKVSILAETVMHEILYEQAVKNHVRLTRDDITKSREALANIYSVNSEKDLDKVGLTQKVLKASLEKATLANKYKSILCEKLDINEAAIRQRINRGDYSSDDQYEQAVQDAIDSETDLKFEPIYNRLKSEYNITINYDYWDRITIGSITAP